MFLLFINDITDYTTSILFADDTAASIKCNKDREVAEKTGELAVLKMKENIYEIQLWAGEWKMKLNADKTQVMVISTSVEMG